MLAIIGSEPQVEGFGIPLYTGPQGSFAVVQDSEAGLWAFSYAGTTVLVQE